MQCSVPSVVCNDTYLLTKSNAALLPSTIIIIVFVVFRCGWYGFNCKWYCCEMFQLLRVSMGRRVLRCEVSYETFLLSHSTWHVFFWDIMPLFSSFVKATKSFYQEFVSSIMKISSFNEWICDCQSAPISWLNFGKVENFFLYVQL